MLERQYGTLGFRTSLMVQESDTKLSPPFDYN